MKSTFYMLFVLVVAIACGKQEDTAPVDAGTRIAGTYEVTTLERQGASAGQSYTQTFPVVSTFGSTTVTQSAQLIATRKTASSVGVVTTFKATGQPDDVRDYGTVDIKGTELYSGATKIGTADGTTLAVGITEFGGRTIATAIKR